MGETNSAFDAESGGRAHANEGSTIDAVLLVETLALDAATSLFDAYGVKLEPDTSVALGRTLAAPLVSIIGFSSTALSGSLILALPRAVAERTLPVPGASLADWSCELANQLLGRLKSRLTKHGVIINMGLPVVMSGTDLTLFATARQSTRHYSLSSALGSVLIRLDLEISETLRIELAAEDGDDTRLAEGDLLFF